MEKPLYPSKFMRITQGYNNGSHIDSYAIDEAGLNGEISTLYTPFTGIIKKIYQEDANEVWLESTEPVEYPDGTIDYMTIMFAHSNDVSNLFVGQKINRNTPFYTEGTKGKATGNHCHIECGKGKFTGTGWHKNSAGNYSINNGKKPEECLWIDDSITILNTANLNFKTIQDTPQTEPEIEPEESAKTDDNSTTEEPISPSDEEISLIFKCSKKGLYGVYLDKNDQLYLKKSK